MSYSKDAKLSDLRGGQDGRKGHYHGKAVKFKSIHQRPQMKPKEQKVKRRRPTTYIPLQDHPWRKTYRKVAAKTNNPPLEVAA